MNSPDKNMGVAMGDFPQSRDRTQVSCVSCTGRQVLQHKHHLASPSYFIHNCFLDVAYLFVLSCVRLFVVTWTVAHQDPLSMGFSRQE